MQANDVYKFWFESDNEENWFQGGDDFDQEIKDKFGDTWLAGSRGELADWRKTSHGRLAEIILLDQFSRNLMRNSPYAYSQDGMALVLAQELIAQSDFDNFSITEKHFALMPFMHSESRAIHELAVSLFKKYTNEDILQYELAHKEIIDRFGRYPHRNETLGRASTPEELLFLMEENSSF